VAVLCKDNGGRGKDSCEDLESFVSGNQLRQSTVGSESVGTCPSSPACDIGETSPGASPRAYWNESLDTAIVSACHTSNLRSAFTYSPSDRKRNRSCDEGRIQLSPLGGSRRFDRGPTARGISVTDKTETETNVGGKTSLSSFQEVVNGTDQVVSQKCCLITSTWKVVIPVY
jgi:hypothetical protein